VIVKTPVHTPVLTLMVDVAPTKPVPVMVKVDKPVNGQPINCVVEDDVHAVSTIVDTVGTGAYAIVNEPVLVPAMFVTVTEPMVPTLAEATALNVHVMTVDDCATTVNG